MSDQKCPFEVSDKTVSSKRQTKCQKTCQLTYQLQTSGKFVSNPSPMLLHVCFYLLASPEVNSRYIHNDTADKEQS